MNERIKKLMIQASDTFYDDEGPYKQLNPEKFAKLIILECCKISDEIEPLELPHKTSKFIKQHFGVKE